MPNIFFWIISNLKAKNKKGKKWFNLKIPEELSSEWGFEI